MDTALVVGVFLVAFALLIVGHVLEKQLKVLNTRVESLTDKLGETADK